MSKRIGNYPHGESHPESKLTTADVLEIKRLYNEEGVKQQWLAKRFGVAQGMISKIVNGHVWQHVSI